MVNCAGGLHCSGIQSTVLSFPNKKHATESRNGVKRQRSPFARRARPWKSAPQTQNKKGTPIGVPLLKTKH